MPAVRRDKSVTLLCRAICRTSSKRCHAICHGKYHRIHRPAVYNKPTRLPENRAVPLSLLSAAGQGAKKLENRGLPPIIRCNYAQIALVRYARIP